MLQSVVYAGYIKFIYHEIILSPSAVLADSGIFYYSGNIVSIFPEYQKSLPLDRIGVADFILGELMLKMMLPMKPAAFGML